MLVSVITPTFNRAKFIEKTILSVKNQDYPLIEHIVVDGLSTDNTIDILNKYKGSYNLNWISEKDSGVTEAINKGFKMAKGDIICWLDSDDFYQPGTIKKVVEIFENHPDVGIVFGNLLVIDENDKVVDTQKSVKFDFSPEMLIYIGMNMGPQAIFWRRGVYEKIGLMDQKYKICADRDFFIRMAKTGEKVWHINKFLANYRQHSQKITNAVNRLYDENREITKEYLPKDISQSAIKKEKLKILLLRFFQYAFQGDLLYIFRGIMRRMGFMHSFYQRVQEN